MKGLDADVFRKRGLTLRLPAATGASRFQEPSLATPTYNIYAIRYARMERKRSDNFIGYEPHDGPMPMDFFVWVIRSNERTILVDTGFNAATAQRRNRVLDRCPIESIASLDIAPEDVQDVVLTHLHYDHAGNLHKLPKARFHLQDKEMDYATGRCMCHAPLRHAYSVEDVVDLVRRVYSDQVVFHAGDSELAPGVELKLIGGHTRGLQAVRVHTNRGWVVLASDASHYYENYETYRPFPIVFSVAEMLEGHRYLRSLADSPDHIIPGHDPLVMQRYPLLPSDAAIACLHEPPR